MLLNPIAVPFYEKKSIEGHRRMPVAHFHDKHELYYLESGKTKYFVGTEIFLLEPGDMIFIPKRTLHRTESLETTSVRRTILYFNDDELEEEFLPYITTLKKEKLVKIHYNKMHTIQNIFSEITAEEEKGKDGYIQMQRLYLKQLLILIKRYHIDNAKSNIATSYKVAESISKYICNNYNSDLSLACLSKKFAMTPSYLSRFFKKSTGISLNEYINIVRITEAEKLLKKANMPITQVAFECGFNDSNYFSAVFKKAKGITPKKFSKTHMP